MPFDADLDTRVRSAAFAFLERLRQVHGEVLPRELLLKGFDFGGDRVSLLSPQQGIFKPRILDVPISVMTAPPSPRKKAPYADEIGQDGLLSYKYRGTDPRHPGVSGRTTELRYALTY